MNIFVERVREAAELADLVPNLNGTGKALCPFHKEDTASFKVYDDGHYYCYGCGRSGSVFDYIMESESLSFWEAVQFLGLKYSIPEPTLSPAEQAKIIESRDISALLEKYVVHSHENLLKNPKALEYVRGRGITDESIETYMIGLGVKTSLSASPILTRKAGLIATGANGEYEPMRNRIVFPIRRGGSIVHLSGRVMDDREPKYMSLPGRKIVPFNSHLLRKPKVNILEGVIDAILVNQEGFPACAAVAIKADHDWAKLVGENTECFVCGDPDETGQQANMVIGGTLHNAGRRVYIVSLPVPYDPASFIQAEGAGAYQVLLDGAKEYMNYLISRLPSSLDSHDLDNNLSEIFDRLTGLSESSQSRYIEKLAAKLKLTKGVLTNDLKTHIRKVKATPVNDGEGIDSNRIVRREKNPIRFNPAQDVIDGVLYYSIYLQTEDKKFKPFIINSMKECFLLTPEVLLERDFFSDASAMPFYNDNRWSIGSNDPYNVYEYLDWKTHIDASELSEKIKWLFTRFLHFRDPHYYDFLTLWTIATYHYWLHDAFGYLFCRAMKGSGKTQALKIMAWLAFNAEAADTITEASVKRLVNANSATLLNDEAERLCKKYDDDQSAIFEVWNGGYKKSGKAIMVNKDTMQVERFCTYSPKALANIRGLDSVLEDRCITLAFERDIGKIPQLVEGEQAHNVAIIRNMLYCFSLEYIEGLAEAKDMVKRPEKLSGREWELWQPILALAKFLDDLGLKSLYANMVDMAVERKADKDSVEEDSNTDRRILIAIWEHVKANPPDKDCAATKKWWYVGLSIRQEIKDDLGWERLPTDKVFANYVFEELHIGIRRVDKKRITQGTTKVPMYHLVPDVINHQAKKMFGIDLMIEPKDDNLDDVPEEDLFDED